MSTRISQREHDKGFDLYQTSDAFFFLFPDVAATKNLFSSCNGFFSDYVLFDVDSHLL